jgi:hypothetical protein
MPKNGCTNFNVFIENVNRLIRVRFSSHDKRTRYLFYRAHMNVRMRGFREFEYRMDNIRARKCAQADVQ